MTDADRDAALAAVAAEFPGWHPWRGIAGLVYARLPRSSPPVVVRAHNITALRIRVALKDAELRGLGREGHR
jgi:hypothetical protein